MEGSQPLCRAVVNLVAILYGWKILTVNWSAFMTAKLKTHQCFLLAYVRMAIPYWSGRSKPANILAKPIWTWPPNLIPTSVSGYTVLDFVMTYEIIIQYSGIVHCSRYPELEKVKSFKLLWGNLWLIACLANQAKSWSQLVIVKVDLCAVL